MVRVVRVGLVLAAAVCMGAAASAPAPGTGAEEISLARAKVQFGYGNYEDCIKTLNALQAKGGDGDVDRCALFLLKAEAQMRTGAAGAAGAAAMSLAAAGKEAKAPEDKYRAQGLEVLVRRTVNFVYTPKTGDTDKRFDILKEAGRKDAAAALWADEQAAAAKKVRAAKDAKALADLLDVARDLPRLKALEWQAGGKTEVCDEWVKTLRERLFVVADATFTASEAKVKTISASAEKPTVTQILVNSAKGAAPRVVNVPRRVGPTQQETATLKALSADHEKFRATLEELATLLAATPEALKTREARNDTLLKQIDTVLTTDYTKPAPAGGGKKAG